MAGKVGMKTAHLPKLRQAREARKWSQRQLATLSGVTQVNISRLENGQPATIPTTRKLARALHISGKVLLGLEDHEILQGAEYGNGSNGKKEAEPQAIELSDSAGTAFMDRIEAGEDEELEEDEDMFFDLLGKYRAKPDSGDLLWSVNGYERNLSQGIAALSRRDREEGAEAVQRVLRRLREELIEK